MSNWPFKLLTPRSYKVIYADPAWAFQGYSSAGVPQRAPDQHYGVMTTKEMALLPVGELAMNDCALCMWSTSSHTEQAFWLARQWGFTFSSKLFTWAKLNKHAEWNAFKINRPKDTWDDFDEEWQMIANDANWFIGMGHGTRRNTEDCWLFTKGKPKRMDRGVRELIVSPIREHSRKPDEAYQRIERLFAGPYCELFARSTKSSWSSWGNETEKYS